MIAWLAGDGIALAALEAPGQPLRDLMDAHEVGRVNAEAGHVERLEPLAQQRAVTVPLIRQMLAESP